MIPCLKNNYKLSKEWEGGREERRKKGNNE
jgi:hypothetical protein